MKLKKYYKQAIKGHYHSLSFDITYKAQQFRFHFPGETNVMLELFGNKKVVIATTNDDWGAIDVEITLKAEEFLEENRRRYYKSKYYDVFRPMMLKKYSDVEELAEEMLERIDKVCGNDDEIGYRLSMKYFDKAMRVAIEKGDTHEQS